MGLVVFTDTIELFVPPAKGTSHVLRLIRELLEFKPRQAQTNIAEAIEYLGRVTNKRSVVFLVSDFFESDFEKPLRIVSQKHDVIAITISDPLERKMPNVGLVELEDAETGELIEIDTSSAMIRTRYEGLGTERRGELGELFRSMDVDQIEVMTNRDYVRDLVAFFRSRERRAQL